MDKQQTSYEHRRRGIRTVIRVAGLVSVVATGLAYGADQSKETDDAARAMRVQPYASGCCNFPSWGPPAPVRAKRGARERLRAARRRTVRA